MEQMRLKLSTCWKDTSLKMHLKRREGGERDKIITIETLILHAELTASANQLTIVFHLKCPRGVVDNVMTFKQKCQSMKTKELPGGKLLLAYPTHTERVTRICHPRENMVIHTTQNGAARRLQK